MVKFSLPLVTLTTVCLIASAAPSFGQYRFTQTFEDARLRPDACIKNDIKEREPFLLWNQVLEAFVSTPEDMGALIGGDKGNKAYRPLKFCISVEGSECVTKPNALCIRKNVEYFLRVEGLVEGYLHVEGHSCDFDDSAGGITIGHRETGAMEYFLTTSHPGKPLYLWIQLANDGHQLYDFKKFEQIPNQCIPKTDIKEYHPFQLLSYDLKTYLSKHINSELLVGGIPDRNKYFQQLEFCIVSTDMECTTEIPTGCIRQNVEYRFRVHGPAKGYLQIEDEQLRIVPDFEDASGLNLYKEKDEGLRIAHINSDGSRSVLETTAPGRAVILNEPEKYNGRQWFEIKDPLSIDKNVHCK
ncbi:hypothetical protein BG000_007832 [Podila horticola]|nr:hypothetical protein BG000_007832 [Podila horticola]